MTAFDAEHLNIIKRSAPVWRASQMDAAFEVFSSLDEPTGAEEDWRYIDYDLPFSSLSPAFEPGPALDPGPFLDALGETSGRILVVDGHVVEAHSDVAELVRMADAGDWETRVPVDHNKLAAAHSAFAADGVEINIAGGQILDTPVVVEVQGSTPEAATFPHISVNVGDQAEARVVVVYRSAPGKRLLMVPEVDLDVADGAILRFLSVQSLDHSASNIVHQRIRIGRDATSRVGEVGLGGDLGRLDLGVNLEGDG
ncbi:MAG TPA: SufD family Fe-S cluster assembly protein, partial [Acidimicrobiia bacterium]|nr:SufD family Fe-S cluster assembly protein [Acidimicrobiia bacterium]